MRGRLLFVVVFACMARAAFCYPYVSVSLSQNGEAFSVDLSRPSVPASAGSDASIFSMPGVTHAGELFIQASLPGTAFVEVSVVPSQGRGCVFSSLRFPWSERPCILAVRMTGCGALDGGGWSVVSADGFLRLPDDGGAQFRSTFPVVSGAELCVRIPVPESGRLACGFALAAVDAQEGGAASDDYIFDLLVTVRALDASGAVLEQSVQALRCQGYLDTAPLDARFAFSVEPTGLCQLYPLSDSGVTSEWRQVAGVSFRSASFVVAAASNGGLAAGTACPFAIALGTDPGCVSTGQFEFTRTDGRAGPSVPFSVRLVPDQTTVAAAGGLEGDGLPVRTSDIHGDLGAYSCMVGMPTFGGGSRFVVVPAVVGQVLDENGSAFGHWGWSGALEIRLPPEVVEDMSRRRVAAGRYHADIYVCVVSRL